MALCWKRIREQRRAFKAACDLLDVAYKKIARHQETLSKIRGLALRMKKDSDLGGTVTLPAPAEPTRQHFSLQIQRDFAGPSLARRSRFLGRER